MNTIDLTGQNFGRLTVLRVHGKNKNGYYWECSCSCDSGKIKLVLSSHLKSGKIQSCGCLHKEIVTKHGMEKHYFYKIWKGMKTRCDNPKDTGYYLYGGRGITYDLNWETFAGFKKDMWIKWLTAKVKYRKVLNDKNHLSIERKDSNGNYDKENCIWIPMNEQGKNTRRLKWFKAVNMATKEEIVARNISEFSRKYNLNNGAICGCLNEPDKRKQHKGWVFIYLPERPFERKIIKK